MKRLFIVKTVLISAAVWFSAVVGQAAVPNTAYPHIFVAPASPKANVDSATLFLAIGSASNSCKVPFSYGEVSFTIQESPLTINPPIFNVTLSYRSLVNTPAICPDIYDPVDYGPTFGLGKLAIGTYNVTDKNTKKQVGSFSVVSFTQTPADTVYVTPGRPTVKDSLYFDLFNASFYCCTQYFNKNVSVSDTVIILSFQYLDSIICPCAFPGESHTGFACEPQKAGRYAIYKEQSAYCPPGQVCPLGLVFLARVGEVTVTAPSTIAHVANAVRSSGFSFWEIKNGIRLDCSLSRPGYVSASIYNAAGMRVAQIYKGTIDGGPRGFSWTTTAPGTYFLSVDHNEAPAVTRKFIISR